MTKIQQEGPAAVSLQPGDKLLEVRCPLKLLFYMCINYGNPRCVAVAKLLYLYFILTTVFSCLQ